MVTLVRLEKERLAMRNSSTSKTTAADEAECGRAEAYYLHDQIGLILRVASQIRRN
jgi:hypothetical protein